MYGKICSSSCNLLRNIKGTSSGGGSGDGIFRPFLHLIVELVCYLAWLEQLLGSGAKIVFLHRIFSAAIIEQCDAPALDAVHQWQAIR